MAEWLLKKGTPLTLRTTRLKTPLMVALQHDSSEVVLLLLRWGASAYTHLHLVDAADEAGNTALHFAAMSNVCSPDLATVLLMCGSSVTKRNKAGIKTHTPYLKPTIYIMTYDIQITPYKYKTHFFYTKITIKPTYIGRLAVEEAQARGR
jgi:hypothetical protein